MKFRSTRGAETDITSAQAIINGISKDGGLYVPNEFPALYESLKKNKEMSYQDLAYEIMKNYFTDFSEEDLKDAIRKAYDGRFEVTVKNNFLELYHGPTCAFKDAALLFLPQIMKKAKKLCRIKEDITILTATSGDTGKAALNGFADVDGIKIVVYYPKDGVSAIQERQMVTQKGSNVKVIGIKGNFDDAQTGVKKIFTDSEVKKKLKEKGYLLSSANSINIGRLIPQVVYYFYGYFNLVNNKVIDIDEKINVTVPTGNFGNILACYYAKKMGLPIDKLICASNSNKVLTDFFNNGVYDKNRKLILTKSPSMDILVSSNLERLLYEACGRNAEYMTKLMDELKTQGKYEVNDNIKDFIKDFYGNYATEDEVDEAVRDMYFNKGYLIDTHTAVADAVMKKYQEETEDNKVNLVISTASPFKFPRSICEALKVENDNLDDFEVLEKLAHHTNSKIPENLAHLKYAEILHHEVCETNKMLDSLYSYLK